MCESGIIFTSLRPKPTDNVSIEGLLFQLITDQRRSVAERPIALPPVPDASECPMLQTIIPAALACLIGAALVGAILFIASTP